MCNIWQLKPQEFLSVADYEKVPSTLNDINISGGEAFMRDDVVDIVKVISQKCNEPRIVVSTNGFRTEKILAAMEEAKAKGEGATVYKGRLVDIASIKQAEVIVRQSEMIAGS